MRRKPTTHAQPSSPRGHATAIAVVVGLLVVMLIGARVWIGVAFGITSINEESLAESVTVMLAFSLYLIVGLVLIARRPDHRLGWVLTAIGVLTSVGVLAESYALLALVHRAEAGLPGGTLAAWINNWYWYPLLALIFVFVPLLFPTGRPLTPRWNWLYYAAASVAGLVTLGGWVKPTLTDGSLRDPRFVVDNPIGVAAVGDLEKTTVGTVLFAALLGLAALALVSLVLRFWRSRGLERQQMKLFVFTGCLMVALPLSEELGLDRFVPDSNIFFAIPVALPPIAIGVAVLKYRLYDIDRIISRTLSYGLLSAVLLSLYLAAVTGLTALTAPVTRQSTVAVAAATLLAAAAFRPVQRRVQALVDRRFNRARYDAARTVEEFRARLRDELDLEAITGDVTSAVDRTVAPSRVVVWLRTEGSR